MRRRTLTVRTLALFAAASAAVHELRYLIAYGAGASHALATHPHGYLSVAMPGVITAALIALAALLMRAAGGRASAVDARGSLPALWAVGAIALASVYATQETLEGAGAFAGSGWIGLALAVPAGLVVAVAIRGADAADALRAATIRLPHLTARASEPGARIVTSPGRIAIAPRGGRGPPLASLV